MSYIVETLYGRLSMVNNITSVMNMSSKNDKPNRKMQFIDKKNAQIPYLFSVEELKKELQYK